jgi:hypothetical protein
MPKPNNLETQLYAAGNKLRDRFPKLGLDESSNQQLIKEGWINLGDAWRIIFQIFSKGYRSDIKSDQEYEDYRIIWVTATVFYNLFSNQLPQISDKEKDDFARMKRRLNDLVFSQENDQVLALKAFFKLVEITDMVLSKTPQIIWAASMF